jgi:hypothetical protein
MYKKRKKRFSKTSHNPKPLFFLNLHTTLNPSFFVVLERLPHIRMSESREQTTAPDQQQDDGRSAMCACVCEYRER